MSMQPTKAGYAAIVGLPNAGKSTFMNGILGTKISIISPKPQTTRKRVLGILTQDNLQVVFTDNPGFLIPRYELQRRMTSYIEDSLSEADVVIFVLDAAEFIQAHKKLPEDITRKFKSLKLPRILLLNKIDLLKDVKQVLPLIKYFADLNIFDEIIPVSALKDLQKDKIIGIIQNYLPESEFFYDAEQLSTQNERFFVSELIRECIFEDFSEEIPFSAEINILEFKEREFGKWFISAEIIVEKTTQKKIIIGEKGSKIKQVGIEARQKTEEHLQKPVYLELFVKVRDKWRSKPVMLHSYGY